MAASLNLAQLIGNLGRDPELRFTGTGKPVARFSLATDRTWSNADGERVERTEWHHVVVWGTLAEVCTEHLRKGQRVYVQGRLRTHSYPHPEHEDVTLYRTEVVAEQVLFLVNGNGSKTEVPEDDELPSLSAV